MKYKHSRYSRCNEVLNKCKNQHLFKTKYKESEGRKFMVSALVLAGGKGKRMKADISKQFIILNGKPILYYTLKRFIDCESIDKIVLVLPKDEVEYCKENILKKYR